MMAGGSDTETPQTRSGTRERGGKRLKRKALRAAVRMCCEGRVPKRTSPLLRSMPGAAESADERSSAEGPTLDHKPPSSPSSVANRGSPSCTLAQAAAAAAEGDGGGDGETAGDDEGDPGKAQGEGDQLGRKPAAKVAKRKQVDAPCKCASVVATCSCCLLLP